MKIEVCEQMVQSWLQHIKGCQIVQTNWMISPLCDISSHLVYVENFMKDISEKLNDEIDAQTLAELAMVDALDNAEENNDNEENVESLMYKNLVHCFAVLNKKESAAMRNIFGKSKPSQFVTQCEIDVVGIKLNTDSNNPNNRNIEKIYLIDSAFHKGTLGYGDAAARVLKKLIRACVVSEIVFGSVIPIEIAFATPQCTPGLNNKINDIVQILRDLLKKHYSPKYDNIQIELYFNDRFADEIYKPLRDNIDALNNDNDLFMRSMNLAKVAESHLAKTPSSKSTKSKISASVSVKSTITPDLEYEMVAEYLTKNIGLEKVEENILGYNKKGWTASEVLRKHGIDDTSKKSVYKGLLIKSSVDDEIKKAKTVEFKAVLKEIKKRGLC